MVVGSVLPIDMYGFTPQTWGKFILLLKMLSLEICFLLGASPV